MSYLHVKGHRAGFALTVAIGTGLVLGGLAWATIPGSGGLINGCYSKTTGALRVIDPSKGQKCATSEAALTWNQRGIDWRGAWSSTGHYAIDDAVSRAGSSYIAIVANIGNRPPSADWGVLASQGSPGGPGQPGPSNLYSTGNPGTNISSSGTTVDTLTLPSGSYLLSAKLDAEAVGTDDGSCFLNAPGGGQIDEVDFVVTKDSETGTYGAQPLSLEAALTTSGGKATLTCTDVSNNNAGLSAEFAKLTAVKVGSSTTQ